MMTKTITVGAALLCSSVGAMAATMQMPSGVISNADKAAMASAMSAAPEAITKNATIMIPDSKGKMRVARKGTNGFTCMPDDPISPGPDPMCMDANAAGWLDAYFAHRTPPANKVGFMYMLMGGTDASNTDPYAKKPPAGGHWVVTGPHVMVVGANPEFYASYPRGADPDTSSPYVMWAGTPYQHLMAPVK